MTWPATFSKASRDLPQDQMTKEFTKIFKKIKQNWGNFPIFPSLYKNFIANREAGTRETYGRTMWHGELSRQI